MATDGTPSTLATKLESLVYGPKVHDDVLGSVCQGLAEHLPILDPDTDAGRVLMAVLAESVERAMPYETTRQMYVAFFAAAFAQNELETINRFYTDLDSPSNVDEAQRADAIARWFQSPLGSKFANAMDAIQRDVTAWARTRLMEEAQGPETPSESST